MVSALKICGPKRARSPQWPSARITTVTPPRNAVPSLRRLAEKGFVADLNSRFLVSCQRQRVALSSPAQSWWSVNVG